MSAARVVLVGGGRARATALRILARRPLACRLSGVLPATSPAAADGRP